MRVLRRFVPPLVQSLRSGAPRPLLALLIVLGVLGASITVERGADRRRAALLRARGAYVQGLAATKARLAQLVAHVATDKTLAQNINWRLSHSVQSTLSGRLQKGGLDQLLLVDAGCRELARVRSGAAPGISCPFAGGVTGKTDIFQWLADEDAPLLQLARHVPGVSGADVFVVGAVALDDDWLAQNPELHELMELMRALDLRIAAPAKSDVALATEGPTVAPALLSREASDLDLLADGADSRPLAPELAGLCLLLALGLAAWALARERQGRHAERARRRELVRWCERLTPGGDVRVGTLDDDGVRPWSGTARNGALGDKAINGTVERLVSHALKQQRDEQRLATVRLAAAEGEIRAKGQELKKLKHRLAELAELDSLAVQLARTTEAFLGRMERFRDEAQDLVDLTDVGVKPCARLLAATLDGWREGIAARGARKFLRGLAETAVAGGAATTRLDEDLALLRTLAGELDDQGLAAAGRARALLETAAFAVKLAGHWRGIALKTHADKVAVSLDAPVEEAQGLVRLEMPGIGFLGGVDPAEAHDIPPLPRTVWVTALYHIYLAMAELAHDGNGDAEGGALIATRHRREGDKVLLVIQAVAKDQRSLPRRGASEAYHLDVSRSILAPFPVTLTVLPSLAGPYPIAITWAAGACPSMVAVRVRAAEDLRPSSQRMHLE